MHNFISTCGSTVREAPTYPMRPPHSLQIVMAMAVLLVTGFFAFYPGLAGPFLFDDIPNLSPLGDQASDTVQGAKEFIFGGVAGPAGRPIAQATFLLDDIDWPSAPYRFKRTNLLLHLMTGLAAFLLARKLLIASGCAAARSDWLALIATGLWLLHPLQTATVFLVVQRMTILSAFFSMLSLLALLSVRQHLLDQRHSRAWLMAAAAIAAGAMAALSKENAVVIPLLASAIERTVAPLPKTRGARGIRWLALWLPSLALLTYVGLLWNLSQIVPWRGFSPAERFTTEGHVLLDYLHLILLPSIRASLYYDNYPLHSYATEGIYALWPWVAILSVSTLAWLWAQTAKWPAFAALFFLAGHALEASTLPLELFFLHRNYLPMFGLILGIAAALSTASSQIKNWRFAPRLIGTLSLLLLTNLTLIASGAWGNEGQLLSIWAAENPGSARARLSTANHWTKLNRNDLALAELQVLLKYNPKHLTADIASYYLECRLERESLEHWTRIQKGINTNFYDYDSSAVSTLQLLAENIRSNHCQLIHIQDVIVALDALAENPKYQHIDGKQIYTAIAVQFSLEKQPPAALAAIERVVAVECQQDLWRAAAGLREGLGDIQGAVSALEHAKKCDPRQGLGRLFIDDEPRRTELDIWIRDLQTKEPPSS